MALFCFALLGFGCIWIILNGPGWIEQGWRCIGSGWIGFALHGLVMLGLRLVSLVWMDKVNCAWDGLMYCFDNN